MFCPRCGAEYVGGFMTCSDCDVPLLDAPPTEEPRPGEERSGGEPVVVFESDRAEVIAIAKSILRSAEVTFGVRGEEVQDLFGYGRFPNGRSLLMGPIQLLVALEDAEDACALLAGLIASADDAPNDDDPEAIERHMGHDGWSRLRAAGKWAARLLVALFALEVLWAVASALVDWQASPV